MAIRRWRSFHQTAKTLGAREIDGGSTFWLLVVNVSSETPMNCAMPAGQVTTSVGRICFPFCRRFRCYFFLVH
jgi:hypothetical protein